MDKLSGIRKIRNGQVKFFGKKYAPSDPHFPYKGELDGTKWFFISYLPREDMLFMWGDEQRHESMRTEEAYDKDCDSRREANITEDGKIRWWFWKPVNNAREEE